MMIWVRSARRNFLGLASNEKTILGPREEKYMMNKA
jgi:hypothetical protein